MEVHVVFTYDGVLGRLARWFGLRWSHAVLRYLRDGAAGARVIEAEACGVRELSWEEGVLVTPDDLAASPLLEPVDE